MSLYKALLYYEADCKGLEQSKKRLDEIIEQSRPYIPDITRQAQMFSNELMQIQNHKKQGKRFQLQFQLHRLEDYWSKDKICEFDNLLKIVDYPNYPDRFDAEDTTDSVRGGLVQKTRKGDIYVISHFGKKIKNVAVGVAALLVVGGALSLYDYSIKNEFRVEPWLFTGFMASLFGGTFGSLYLHWCNVKNPFESLASELVKRAEYIEAHVPR